ncbi:MAG: hypothetical protein ABII12_09255 [Planctomycetota bacterium]
MSTENAKRTRSEPILEDYFRWNGYCDYEFEPSTPGKTKHPDYRLRWHHQELFIEVKQLEQKRKLPPPGVVIGVDIYKSLRKLIDKAREKFREYGELCCCLAVFNNGDWTAILEPDAVFEAMLGDGGIKLDFNAAEGRAVPGTGRLAFLDGGKMLAPNSGKPQNTTISVILVIEERRLNDPVFENRKRLALDNFEREEGRPASKTEKARVWFSEWQKDAPTKDRVPRLVAYKNPFASICLPVGMFCGDFDEVYEYADGRIGRIFAGSRVQELFMVDRPGE